MKTLIIWHEINSIHVFFFLISKNWEKLDAWHLENSGNGEEPVPDARRRMVTLEMYNWGTVGEVLL